MEFDELLITTGVDALVRLVKQKSKVELEEASKTLNIPSETIEDWSRVLEEEGILRIEYRLTKVYLVWIKPTEEEVVSFVNESFKNTTSEDIRKIEMAANQSTFLDLDKQHEDGGYLKDLIKDSKPLQDEVLENKENYVKLFIAAKVLFLIEIKVLILKYGDLEII